MECIVALMQPPRFARRFRSSGDGGGGVVARRAGGIAPYQRAWTAMERRPYQVVRLKLVGPPEFFDPPTNAVVLHVSTRSLINAESQSR